jgi:chromosome segregation ATPase
MSWINAVKGAIFEDSVPANQPATVPANTPVLPAGSVATSVPTAQSEMIATIRNTTLARKTAYTALLEAADKMISIIPDVNTRLKAAYAMVGGEQRTVNTIIQALDVHISDVDGEKGRFAQFTQQQYANEVESVRTQAANLTADTQRIQQQIAELNQQVATNTNRVAELNQQADTRQRELDSAVSQFNASAQVVRSEFEQQRSSLATILQ